MKGHGKMAREFIDNRIQGKTYQEIAQMHGVSKQYVHQIVKSIVDENATYGWC